MNNYQSMLFDGRFQIQYMEWNGEDLLAGQALE